MGSRSVGDRQGGAAVLLALALLAGCDRPAAPAADVPPATAPDAPPAVSAAPAPAAEPALLQDLAERTPTHVIGISYPAGLAQYPGLAQHVHEYAMSARAGLLKAVEGLGNDTPPAPYELSLGFSILLETPELVVVAADGSRYTGGAHGEPLVARFVWLRQQQRQLTAASLIPEAAGWAEVGRYAAAQLHASAEARGRADRLPDEEREEYLRSSDRMIAEGTAPLPEHFAEFEPRVDGAGKISAVRFVFPPYQVAPYSDGTRTVDVPAALLRPLVAAEYAGLFAGG